MNASGDSPKQSKVAAKELTHQSAEESFLDQVKNTPKLPVEDEDTILAKIRNGDFAALETFVSANLHLVIPFAKKYESMGVQLADLLQAGSIGLLKAIDCWDPTRCKKFGAHANWWIKGEILKELRNHSRDVRLPEYRRKKMRELRGALDDLYAEFEREPTTEELAERLEMTVEEAEELISLKQPPLYLDAPISDDNTTSGMDLELEQCAGIDDQLGSDNPWESLENERRRKAVDEALTRLDERRRIIIQNCFGFSGDGKMTLQETGNALGLTPQRVHQIIQETIVELRNDPQLAQFRD